MVRVLKGVNKMGKGSKNRVSEKVASVGIEDSGRFVKVRRQDNGFLAAQDYNRRMGWDMSKYYVVVDGNDISVALYIGEYWDCNKWMSVKFARRPNLNLGLRTLLAISEKKVLYMGSLVNGTPAGVLGNFVRETV